MSDFFVARSIKAAKIFAVKKRLMGLVGLGWVGLSVSLAGINDGLVAYYPFDGNALDVSGNEWHGTNHTGLVQFSSGRIGRAAWFDGASCIRLPQPRLLDGASNATVSAWVWFSSSGGGQILGAGDSRFEHDPIITRITPTAAEDCRFGQVVGGQQTLIGFGIGESIPGLSVGSWHLFTFVLQRQTTQTVFRCYVDATLVKQSVSSQFTNIAYDADMPALVGAIEAASPKQFWNGGIDDLRIYNHALSDGEIADLASGEEARLDISVSVARVNDGLVSYYPFDGNALDASGNDWHGSNHTGLVQYDAGKIAQAAWFDGASCIRLPQPRLLDGASNATISAWIWLSNSLGGQIVGAGDVRYEHDPIIMRVNPAASEDCHYEQVVSGQQTLLGFDNGEPIAGLSVGAWHLFTMVLERRATLSAFRCYVDAALVKQSVSSQFTNIAYDADMPALVGAIEANSPWQFWNGGIDDLRMYNRALTESEVAYLASGNPTPANNLTMIQVCWNSPTNKISQLQYRASLTSGSWTNVGSTISQMGTRICFTDELKETNGFYRVVILP